MATTKKLTTPELATIHMRFMDEDDPTTPDEARFDCAFAKLVEKEKIPPENAMQLKAAIRIIRKRRLGYDPIRLGTELMGYIRGKFATTAQGLRFDEAFNHLMKENKLPGDDEGWLKSAIGSALNRRPRPAKPEDNAGAQATAQTPKAAAVARKSDSADKKQAREPRQLSVQHQSRVMVILQTQIMGETMTFRRHKTGEAFWHAEKNFFPDERLRKRAMEMARTVFADEDRKAAAATQMQDISQTEDAYVMLLAGKYVARFTRGLRGAIVAVVTLNDRKVDQSAVPDGLVAKAKKHAKQYFAGVGTPELAGM